MPDKIIEPSRKRARDTLLAKDPNYFHHLGQKAAEVSKTKFTSETARAAVQKRWAKHREAQNGK